MNWSVVALVHSKTGLISNWSAVLSFSHDVDNDLIILTKEMLLNMFEFPACRHQARFYNAASSKDEIVITPKFIDLSGYTPSVSADLLGCVRLKAGFSV